MDSQLYISSAILGVFLAIICIYGWRRIVPVVFFGLILVKVAPAQSGGDVDNDVPAINEVRDAIQYQMSVLQYELQQLDSGGTQTQHLQTIANAVDNGYSTIRDQAVHTNNYLSGVYSTGALAEIKNNLQNGGQSAAYWLNQIAVSNNAARQYLQGTQSGPLTDIDNSLINPSGVTAINELTNIKNSLQTPNATAAQSLENINSNTANLNTKFDDAFGDVGDTYSMAWIGNKNRYMNELSLGVLEDSLIELEDINNKQVDTDNDVPAIQALQALLSGYGQWDTDNDVDAIEAVEMKVDLVGDDVDQLRNANTNENTQILAALTSISNAMNEIDNAPNVSPPADIVLTTPTTNVPTFETVAPDPLQVSVLADLADVDQDESKLKPFTEIEQNIDDNIAHFDDTTQWDIPLFGNGNIVNLQHANMLGNIQETINGDMRQHFVTLSAIIKPILTAFLIWIVIRWTTRTTLSTVSG